MLTSNDCYDQITFPGQKHLSLVWTIELREDDEVVPVIEYVRRSGRIPGELVEFFAWLAASYAGKTSWRLYNEIEDMKSDALLQMIRHAGTFNPDRGKNPIRYFSQVIDFSFRRYLQGKNKHSTIKDNLGALYWPNHNEDIYDKPF